MASRLRALLLTLLVVGGYVVPDLDALLYHSGHANGPQPAHVELPSGCGSHGEHCLLGAAAARAQLTIQAFGRPVLRLGDVTRSGFLPTITARCNRRAALQHSRAPPPSLG